MIGRHPAMLLRNLTSMAGNATLDHRS